ncbi:MAG: hypothetical protein E7323_00400 [Clostridiales bacterium]|nr:hypothetical protein [Clostridiales bacterium]
MKKRTISVQTLSILAITALIILILPLLITSIYNRPIADDLVQPYAPTVTYRETGSFWQAFVASIKETISIWHARNGIFSSMFLSVFAPYIFNYTYGFIHPVLVIALMIFASYKAAKCLWIINAGIPRAYIHLIAALLSIALITTMPDISGGIYWYSGAVNYTFYFALSLLLFACLFQAVAANRPATFKNCIGLFFSCIGFFLLGGANWMTPTLSIVVYGFLAIYIIARKKSLRFLLPFLFLLIGYMVAILAPGNANRQAVVGERLPLFESFVNSFLNAIQTCTHEGRYYFFGILLLPVFARLSQYVPKLPKYWFLVPVGSVCVLAAAFFPLIFSSYPILDRHDNMVFLHFTVLLFINEALLVVWIAQGLSAVYQKGDLFSLNKTIAFVLAFALIFAAVFETTLTLSPFRVTSEYAPLKAAIHLVQGHSKRYAQSYDDLVDTLQTTEETEVVSSLDLQSPLLGSPGIHWDPTFWTNVGFVTFYTDKNITLKSQ